VVSGTSYSAAFAAGIAARLKDARPGLTPSGILSALRKAAKSAGDGPAILNLQSALAQLPNP